MTLTVNRRIKELDDFFGANPVDLSAMPSTVRYRILDKMASVLEDVVEGYGGDVDRITAEQTAAEQMHVPVTEMSRVLAFAEAASMLRTYDHRNRLTFATHIRTAETLLAAELIDVAEKRILIARSWIKNGATATLHGDLLLIEQLIHVLKLQHTSSELQQNRT